MAAVIFDVDGTLIDSVDLHAEAWCETLGHFGVEADFDDLRANIGKGGDQLMPGFVPPDLLATRGTEIEEHRAQLFKSAYLPKVRAFPAVRQLFERICADGKLIILASSASAREVAEYLKITGVEDLVAATTSSDEAAHSKPFPDIFQAALAKGTGTPASQALAIGDTPYDAEAARAAGMGCVGVLSGGFDHRSLMAAGCEAVYRDPQHLLEEYDRSPLHTLGR